jgi:acyl carrier protein
VPPVLRDERRQKLVAFLETIRRPEVPLDVLDDEAGLVSSGLIDSLALLEIIAFLEDEFGMDFEERGVDPEELASVSRILDLVEQEVG